MKRSMKTIIALAAVVLTFAAVQAAWAAEITVTGTIERIGTASIDVADEETIFTFYHIPFTDLTAAGIDLYLGDTVTVKAYLVTFPNETSKNIAFSITKDDTTYVWHPNMPKTGTKAGNKTVTLSATDMNGQPCLCNCIETTECDVCNCYCGSKAR
ncbi:MAG: hypothetical protein H6Q04_2622 [Acidobacteria bacterium]|nr:hypothetical protein [Acidobacteriota bacterium]